MISSILYLRLKQLVRVLNDLGFIRFLFLFLIFSSVCFLSYIAAAEDDGSTIITLITLAILYFIHINRTDHLFLVIYLPNYKLLQFIEYLTIAIPVILGLVFHLKWIELTILLGLSGLIVIFVKPFKKRTLNTIVQRSVYSDAFEWKAGLRKSFYWVSLLWLAGMATFFWPGSIPLAIVLIGLIVIGFFENNEPLNLLFSFEKPPVRFLLSKIRTHITLYSIAVMPLIVVFLIAHFQYWYLAILPYLLVICILTYTVFCKYSFYIPASRSSSQIFNLLGFISVILPIFFPLIILLGIRFYFRAVSNLNQYLYDYN